MVLKAFLIIIITEKYIQNYEIQYHNCYSYIKGKYIIF